jgi:glucose/arabinose dehydrogenase
MSKRVFAMAGLATAMTAALTVPAASADSGPPPPTSTNGHPVQLVASGLKTPTSFAFGDGKVFVGDGGDSEGSAPPNGGVYVLDKGAAVKVPSKFKFVAGVTWHHHKLYVSGAKLKNGRPSWQLGAWSGWNGTTFTHRKVLYVAKNKKFDGFNGIGFGKNGRLYVGVDVGLTDGNDHGPAKTSPHLYKILTFRANGKDLETFAKGMRQPWQLAFKPGSNSPYVTDLGQDSGAKNPPDFVLHVKAGDNYGFPKCNHTKASAKHKKCAGFTKPFRKFGPHTDLMGIAVHGGKLYMTSFAGQNPTENSGGEVFTMGLKSHKLKPLVTGFVAPTVGLGYHKGYVYVGELTGQVYRVKV